jgi:translation initiation factor 1
MVTRSFSDLGGLVYSTDVGRTCPACRQAMAACACKTVQRPVGDGVVRVSRETKGRAGKGVTLVRGLPLDDVAIAALGKQLKASCGSGGTVKDGTIEVQGDHCDRIITVLRTQGYAVKRTGG